MEVLFMNKKNFKNLISVVLAITMVMGITVPVFAEERNTTTAAITIAKAKTAFVNNVTEDGSNLTDDLHLNSNTMTLDVSICIKQLSNNGLQITSNIDNRSICVNGIPTAKSANAHAIFYQATNNDSSLEVVNMEYVDNAETNMFFKDYKSRNNAQQILKIYLKDLSSNTRDYIILECFDYKIVDFNSLISELPQDTTMGAWAAREFSPVNTSYSDIVPYSSTSNLVRNYSVEYNDLALKETHRITIAADCTYSNIRIGQTADIIYRIEVTGKSMTCPDNPSLNSSTESYLHVDSASLRQTSVPNTAFVSSSIDGKVQNNSFAGPELSASIGVNLGAIGVSLSIPVSFSGSNTVDINNTYNGFVNGRDGKYTRSIKTTMQSKYKLTKKGHYFEVRSTMADFGNVAKSVATHKAIWNVSIINAGDMSTQSKSITQNVPIEIKK